MQLSSAMFPVLPASRCSCTILLFLEVGRRIGVKRLDVPGARARSAWWTDRCTRWSRC